MHLGVGSVHVFLVAVGFVLAVPFDTSTTLALEKRQAGGNNSNNEDEAAFPSGIPSWQSAPESGIEDSPDPASQQLELEQEGNEIKNDGGGDNDEEDDEFSREMKARIEAWNNIPPLPPDLLDAVDYQTRIEVLAIVRALSRYGKADFDDIFAVMRALKPFISRGRAKIIIENTIIQVEMAKRKGLSIDVLLEEKLRNLNVEELEEQMEAMVRFRREHEGEPDPSADLLKLPMPSPLSMLTGGQDRMLIIAKARAGLVDFEQLKEYILRQNPYLRDQQADVGVRKTLIDLSTVVANFEAVAAGPSAFQKFGNWFNKTFRKDEENA